MVIEVKSAITMAVKRATKFDFGKTLQLRNADRFKACLQSGGPVKLLAGSARADAENCGTVPHAATMNAFGTGKVNAREEDASPCAPCFAPSRHRSAPSRGSR